MLCHFFFLFGSASLTSVIFSTDVNWGCQLQRGAAEQHPNFVNLILISFKLQRGAAGQLPDFTARAFCGQVVLNLNPKP